MELSFINLIVMVVLQKISMKRNEREGPPACSA